jgi:hypothetical protein
VRVKIYKYIYVTVKAGGIFNNLDHRELIDKYSQEGLRFVTAIPTAFGNYVFICNTRQYLWCRTV